MANEQIVITEGNSGIEIQVQFLDNKKKPIPILTGDSIEICFVSPYKDKHFNQAYVIDAPNGVCGYILDTDRTDITKLWNTYWSLTNDASEVTAQERLVYYVLPKHGGA